MTPQLKSEAPALEYGLTILELVSSSPDGVTCNKLIESLPASKSTTLRLLKLLLRRGYLKKQAQTGLYMPGPKMSFAGLSSFPMERLRETGSTILKSLVDDTDNTSLLVYWTGLESQIILKEQRVNGISMLDIGTITADYLGAPWGWIFYQHLDPVGRKHAQSRNWDKARFDRDFPRWMTFFEEHGFTYDDCEFLPHIRRFAAPVYAKEGKLLGAIGLGGSPLTIPDEKVMSVGKAVVAYAQQLSELNM